MKWISRFLAASPFLFCFVFRSNRSRVLLHCGCVLGLLMRESVGYLSPSHHVGPNHKLPREPGAEAPAKRKHLRAFNSSGFSSRMQRKLTPLLNRDTVFLKVLNFRFFLGKSLETACLCTLLSDSSALEYISQGKHVCGGMETNFFCFLPPISPAFRLSKMCYL